MERAIANPAPDAPAEARFSVVRVTPDTAPGLLAARRPGARRQAGAVASYAQAMRAGEWLLNGMPIILSRRGLLLDGVQRLHACLEAGAPFPTVLAEGVPDDTVHTIDQQRRRSFAGVLETRGVDHASAVAGLLSKLIRVQDGTVTSGASTPPWSRMERALHANRAGIEAAIALSFSHPARDLTEAIRTPLCFMGLQAAPDALRRFLDAIADPVRFAADEPGAMIRRRLLEGRADRAHRLPPVTLFALCLKALADTMAGARSPAYTWSDIARHPKSGEHFPRLPGYRGLRDAPEPTGAAALPAAGAPAPPAGTEDLSMRVETIGPVAAARYLKANLGNRNVVASHVAAMARDIGQGRWMFNAQPICFSGSGRLLNGQHRLSAVLEAGQPIEVLVMRGLPERAFETYDKQAKKAPATEELFGDFGDRPLVSAAAVLLWKRERRPPGQPHARPTAAEVGDVIRGHPEFLGLRGFSRKMVRYGRSSAMLYAAHRILRDDPRLGPVFLERFETGAELPAGHPILRLRDRLLDLRGPHTDQNAQIDEVLAAWTRFRRKPGIALPAGEPEPSAPTESAS